MHEKESGTIDLRDNAMGYLCAPMLQCHHLTGTVPQKGVPLDDTGVEEAFARTSGAGCKYIDEGL